MLSYYSEMERSAKSFSFEFTGSIKHHFPVSHKAMLEVGGASRGQGGGGHRIVETCGLSFGISSYSPIKK